MIEILEQRRLLSATVVETYPGFFEIHGDNGANDIAIEVSMNDETFTLDGNTYCEVAYLMVFGYGGNDNISVLTIDGPGWIGASISAGDGSDVITLNFDGAVWAGSGNDVLYLSDSFRGEAYGEGGDDQIFISGACFDAEIRGGDGDDLIDCSNNFYPVVVRGGAGDDTIIGSAFDDQIYGDGGSNVLYGNGGNDIFYWVTASDQVFGGDGYDIVYLRGVPGSMTDVEEVVYG